MALVFSSISPFRHFAISSFRHFAISPFRVLNTPEPCTHSQSDTGWKISQNSDSDPESEMKVWRLDTAETCLSFTLVCWKSFTRRRYGRLSVVKIPRILVSLNLEEKVGFERFVEEVKVIDSDKPNSSDLYALARVSVMSIPSTATTFWHSCFAPNRGIVSFVLYFLQVLYFSLKMISAQHLSNNGKNWQKLSYQKILLAW